MFGADVSRELIMASKGTFVGAFLMVTPEPEVLLDSIAS
jgi:hypothetical protein